MDDENRTIAGVTPEAGAPETAPEASAPKPAAAPAPADPERYAAPEIDDNDDDAPTEWVPSRFEKRIHAIPEKQWNLYQTLAGLAIGAFTVFALFFGGQGLNPLFLAAIVLALLVPNMLEDRGRRRLSRGRIVMIITMAVGIAAMAIYFAVTKRGDAKPEEIEAAEAALRTAKTFLA